MSFLKKLLGLGFVAGAAYGAYAYVQNVRAQKEATDDNGVISTIGDLTNEDATYAIVPGDDEDEGDAPIFAQDFPDKQAENVEYTPAPAKVKPAPILFDAEGPNANPIEAAPATRLGSGYIDPTTIATAEDFQNWDELGCRS